MEDIEYELPTLLRETPRREPSMAESYLRARLDGVVGQYDVLDRLPFYAVTMACLRFGNLENNPIGTKLEQLDSMGRYRALAVGFSVLKGGRQAIADLIRSVLSRSPSDSAHALMGGVYAFLVPRKRHPGYPELATLTAQAYYDMLPFGLNEKRSVLGIQAPQQGVYTVYEAARKYGLDDRTIRGARAVDALVTTEIIGSEPLPVLRTPS